MASPTATNLAELKRRQSDWRRLTNVPDWLLAERAKILIDLADDIEIMEIIEQAKRNGDNGHGPASD